MIPILIFYSCFALFTTLVLDILDFKVMTFRIYMTNIFGGILWPAVLVLSLMVSKMLEEDSKNAAEAATNFVKLLFPEINNPTKALSSGPNDQTPKDL